MTTETAPATSEKMLDNRDLMRMYWRSTFLLGSFNFERMQAMGFCYTLMPAIRKVYRGDKAAEAAALKRHLEFYNTQPWVSSVVFGVTAAMEEQKAKGEDISEETITSVKVGLMGPLAGVGDPIFWGTARPVLAALGASLALNGSIVGPLLFFIGINVREASPAAARAFIRAFKVPYPSIFDPDAEQLLKFSGTLPASGIPSTLVIDTDGRIAARIVGEVSKTTLVALVQDTEQGR